MATTPESIAQSIMRQINQRLGLTDRSAHFIKERSLKILPALIGEIEITMDSLKDETP